MVKMQVTLEIELDEADMESRQLGECDGELPSVDELSPTEFGDMVASHMESEDNEFWAGSDIYAKIISVHCTNSKFC